MHANEGRPEWGSVYAQNKAMKGVFARRILLFKYVH
jgi:hypothetical protein